MNDYRQGQESGFDTFCQLFKVSIKIIIRVNFIKMIKNNKLSKYFSIGGIVVGFY